MELPQFFLSFPLSLSVFSSQALSNFRARITMALLRPGGDGGGLCAYIPAARRALEELNKERTRQAGSGRGGTLDQKIHVGPDGTIRIQ